MTMPFSRFYISVFCLLFGLAALICADNEVAVLGQLRKSFPDWEPRGMIDVGANKGGWSLSAHKLYPKTKLFMAEAFPQNEEKLRQAVADIGNDIATYRISVLSAREGEKIRFYQSDTGFTTGNSMFKETTNHYETGKYTEHTTSTLDSLVTQAGSPFSDISGYDYLKLDVQGAELVVLQGASNILRQVTFVQLEVSLIQYNEGGACMWQVDELLRANGFFLYDLGDLVRNPDAFRTKGVAQMDILYVKPTSDALPLWLKEHQVNMCGSSNQHMMSAAALFELPEDKAQVLSWQMLFGTVTFFLGFVFGKVSSKRKDSRHVR